MKIIKRCILTLICISTAACSGVKPRLHLPQENTNGPQNLVIFMDGTANDESSHTNISKLSNLVNLQNKTNVKTAYIEGVGTAYRALGMGMGTGLSNDIKHAYAFLTSHYKSTKDKIFLFGFSRGAYGARALAGLIQVAGIPDLSNLTSKERKRVVEMIFRTYKTRDTFEKRRENIKSIKNGYYTFTSKVNIEFVGIWDTVEALAIPDYEENNLLENKQYIDQLCNVENVFHALSLDDDRAKIFTPILLNDFSAKQQCDKDILENRNINQVFFSGAHSDVGGGYSDTDISGVSLNWMIDKLSSYELLPKDAQVYADAYGKTHDPEAALNKVYRFKHRDLSKYAALLDEPFTVHASVIDRLKHVYPQCYETQWDTQDNIFRHCFVKKVNDENIVFEYTPKNEKCILTVDPSGYSQLPPPQKLTISKASCEGDEVILPCTQEVKINPKNKNYKTPFKIMKSNSYVFSLKTTDWNDDGTCATPENGRRISRSDSSLLMKALQYVAKPFTFDPRAGYMELIGEVAGQAILLGQLARDGEIFSPEEDGRLVVRVNEPVIGSTFYENNEGSATLYITRVR